MPAALTDLKPKTLRALKGESKIPLWLYILAPASLLYSLVVRARAFLYHTGICRVKRLPCGVISVGNVTAGGTGKTPMVVMLARLLKERGIRVAVLTRGYRGRLEGSVALVSDGERQVLPPEDAGDEATLLAKSLPGIPVVMGSDRHMAGLMAIERFGVEAVILDDGFQHMALHRDLNILLMDAAHPFGNGFTLPMGYLREPKSAIGRADMVVLTRADMADADSARAAVFDVSPKVPVLTAAHRPTGLYDLLTGSTTGLDYLSGRTVLALSALADPSSFTLILQKLNAKIAIALNYPDHHRYTQTDMAEIEAAARNSGGVVVTTEKDAVKLAGLVPGEMSIFVLAIEVELTQGREALDRALADVPGMK